MAQKSYVLVEVDSGTLGQLYDDLAAYPGVGEVTEHGPGCCCKNCPWGGDHGWRDGGAPHDAG
jgi:hypothetical protein